MSTLHPILLSELAKIIYASLLQEAEQSRRLATLIKANRWPWFFSLGNLFKPKSEAPSQPERYDRPQSTQRPLLPPGL